jgi:hypothetical protein
MTARYVKVVISSNWGDASWVTPTSIHICNTAGEKQNTPEMTHTGTVATGGGVPENLSDTTTSNYWQVHVDNFPNVWWQVDFGSELPVNKIKIQVLQGYTFRAIKNFEVFVSHNGTDFVSAGAFEGAYSDSEQTFDLITDQIPQNFLLSMRDRMRKRGLSLGVPTLSDGNMSFLVSRRNRLRTLGISLEPSNVYVPPFSPGTIPGCLCWFAADQITGLANNDYVTTWPDLTINDKDFAQSNADYKPQYQTGVVNSLPALFFDGNDRMLTPSLTGIRTVLAVAKFNGATFTSYNGLLTGATAIVYLIGANGSPNLYDEGAMARYKDGVSTLADATNAWHVFIAISSGTYTFELQTGWDRNNGWTYGWQGHIAEIAAYDSVLTPTQIADVTASLKTKYGIT